MSRPFSYNDENFTVIGNVCFVHIRIDKALQVNEVVATIPPGIFDRLIVKSCYSIIQRGNNYKVAGGTFDLRINDKGDIYTSAARTDPAGDYYFFTAFLYLKNI